MPVFCFSSQFKMLMFENTKAQFKRKWKKNKTIHMNICYSGVILVSRVLQGIFIVTPLSLNLLFLKGQNQGFISFLNFPLTGIKESKILMKQQDFNRCTNITMKLLWHLIRNWMLSNIDYCSKCTLLTIFAKQTSSATTNNCTRAMHTE